MTKPRLLDLFCGAGGAAMGYYRAGFEVVGVDINPQPYYPFEFIQADALTFPLAGFDAIHASCVCKADSPINAVNKAVHPRQIPVMRERLIASGVPWVIENVPQAALLYGIRLCGQMFGLPVIRHRDFESSHLLWAPAHPKHTGRILGIFGNNVWDYSKPANTPRRDGGHRTGSATAAEGRVAMGTPWIRGHALSQAIPPAYTEWIGQQLLSVLSQREGIGA